MAPYWILAAYAAGIASITCAPPPQPVWSAVIAAGLLLGWLPLRRGPLAIVPLAGAVALSGWLWAGLCLSPPLRSDHPVHFVADGPVGVEGIVEQVERRWDGTTRLDVAAESIAGNGRTTTVSGLVRLGIRSGSVAVVPGEKVCWRGRLRRPVVFGTPGEFDYPRYLAARGIYVTASLSHATELLRMAPTASAPAGFWERIRHVVAETIDRAVPTAESGPLQSLLVGFQGGITPEQRRLLSEGGLAHLFSISGLHFGLLALLLYQIARWLYCRSERLLLLSPPRRMLPPLLLPPLIGYLLISGNAAPTQRSFCMIVLGVLLFHCQRRASPSALLATAGIAMLTIAPLTLFDPSLQLSFAGVLGLVILMPRWQLLLNERPIWQRTVGTMLFTTLAASIATAPLVLWHFHQFAPAGLITNLLAIPVVALGAVPVGLAGILLLPLLPAGADLCFAVAGTLVGITLRWTAWCLELPGLDAMTLYVAPRTVVALAGLMIAGLLLRTRRRLAMLLAAAAVLTAVFPSLGTSRLRVMALSVGQGDATLVSIAGTMHYLVDGGGLTGTDIDIGERLVAPALGHLGATRLRGVILTHDHPDHSAGLPYVLEHCTVDNFWSAIPLDELSQPLAEVLVRRAIPVHQLPPGWTALPAGQDAQLTIFVPSQEADDLNDRSLILHAVAGGAGVLLPGDMATYGLQQLMDAGLPEPVTLLKLPHHGSRGSQPQRLLDSLRPDIAFVSAGRNNAYRLPHPSSVAACRERGVPLYRTDLQGTLSFATDGTDWQASCFTADETVQFD